MFEFVQAAAWPLLSHCASILPGLTGSKSKLSTHEDTPGLSIQECGQVPAPSSNQVDGDAFLGYKTKSASYRL